MHRPRASLWTRLRDRQPRRLAVALAGCILLPCGLARAVTTTTVVTPEQPQGWAIEIASTLDMAPPTGSARFQLGPAAPPRGLGSLRLDTGSDSYGGVRVRSKQLQGRRLADLSTLRYSTYVFQNGSCQAPALVLHLDTNNDGVGDDSLVFEPCYQTGGYPVPDQGAVQRGVWQTWDARVGGFWLRTGGPPVFTLASYLKTHPDATLVNTAAGSGGLQLFVGFGVSYDASVDALEVGFGPDSTLFDFEPSPPPDLAPPADLATPDLARAPDLASAPPDMAKAPPDMAGGPPDPGGCTCRVSPAGSAPGRSAGLWLFAVVASVVAARRGRRSARAARRGVASALEDRRATAV